MTCPHLQNGRCALAELLARKILGAEPACVVTDDQCKRCQSTATATEQKPTVQVTAAVTRSIDPSQRIAWAAFAGRIHLGSPRPLVQVSHQNREEKESRPRAITGKRLPPQPPGPGTVLAKILKDEYDAKEEANCPCNSRMAQMNSSGIAWCEANIEKIVGWLLEEVSRRRLPQAILPERVQRWGLRRIVRRAINESRDWQPPPAPITSADSSGCQQ